MNLTPSAWMSQHLRLIPSDRLGTHTRAAAGDLARSIALIDEAADVTDSQFAHPLSREA